MSQSIRHAFGLRRSTDLAVWLTRATRVRAARAGVGGAQARASAGSRGARTTGMRGSEPARSRSMPWPRRRPRPISPTRSVRQSPSHNPQRPTRVSLLRRRKQNRSSHSARGNRTQLLRRNPSRFGGGHGNPQNSATGIAATEAAPADGNHEANTPAVTGAFGSQELPPGVRSLPSAFARAIPPATGADPIWQSLPHGHAEAVHRGGRGRCRGAHRQCEDS